jgi:hypothetical protein
MARQGADIGPGKFFHGTDQHRQPPSFAVSRAPGLSRMPGLSGMPGPSRMPRLKPLTHRLSLPKPVSAGPVINPELAIPFRATLP